MLNIDDVTKFRVEKEILGQIFTKSQNETSYSFIKIMDNVSSAHIIETSFSMETMTIKQVFTQTALNIKDFGIGGSFSYFHTGLIDNGSKIWVAGDNTYWQYGIATEDEMIFTKLENLVAE